MIEKLSLDFVRKIYNILTTGNDDVNFYCMCLQNQNREAATNNPVKFGLELKNQYFVQTSVLQQTDFHKDCRQGLSLANIRKTVNL